MKTAEQRIINVINSVIKEINERKVVYEMAYKEYQGSSNPEDKFEIMDMIMDTLDGILLRMTVYEEFINKLKDKADHPSESLEDKALYQNYIDTFIKEKIVIDTLEKRVIGMVN